MHCATAAGPEVAHAWRDGVKGVKRLAKRWQGQRLHMPFNISVGLIRAAAGKAAEGGGWHRHRSSPLQGKLHAHHDACERVAVETVHCAVIGVLGRRQDSHGTGHMEFGVEFSWFTCSRGPCTPCAAADDPASSPPHHRLRTSRSHPQPAARAVVLYR